MPNFSGIYFPGRNWQALLSFIWDAGGDIAVTERRVGRRAGVEESVAGLRPCRTSWSTPTRRRPTPTIAKDFLDFCNGEVAMLMGPGWKMGQITGEDGCPGKYDAVLGAFALPGSEGEVAPSFLGGSNLGISGRARTRAWRSSSSRCSPARRTRPSSPRSG